MPASGVFIEDHFAQEGLRAMGMGIPQPVLPCEPRAVPVPEAWSPSSGPGAPFPSGKLPVRSPMPEIQRRKTVTVKIGSVPGQSRLRSSRRRPVDDQYRHRRRRLDHPAGCRARRSRLRARPGHRQQRRRRSEPSRTSSKASPNGTSTSPSSATSTTTATCC